MDASRRLGALAAAVIVGSAAAGLIYQARSSRDRPLAESGFDIADVSRRAESVAAPLAPARSNASSLGLVQALPGIEFGQAPPPADAAAPAEGKRPSIQEIVKQTEGHVAALAMAYTRRYPLIREYGREWMSYPDLKKLNDDYMRRHDPVAFLLGLAGSKSFAKMVQKYAVQKPIRDFVIEGVKTAPPEAVQASFEHIHSDARLKTFVDGVALNLGLPAAVVAQPTPLAQKQ